MLRYAWLFLFLAAAAVILAGVAGLLALIGQAVLLLFLVLFGFFLLWRKKV